MMILITGGSGSGKSAYAEEYAGTLSKNCRKYYIATMQVLDREGQKRVQRHRSMRAGKGFVTIEQPTDIEKAIDKINKYTSTENAKTENTETENTSTENTSTENIETKNTVIKNTALLECVSNLTANEMFAGEKPKDRETVTEKMIRGIELLNKKLTHLVIVTNNVFEDGITYDETTMEYIKAMGSINEKLAKMADQVIEVVVGIPVFVKNGDIGCGL